MRRVFRIIITPILCVLVFIVAFKAVQKICWETNMKSISPPSLQSWDPTERMEAAGRAGRKYGGKQ